MGVGLELDDAKGPFLHQMFKPPYSKAFTKFARGAGAEMRN